MPRYDFKYRRPPRRRIRFSRVLLLLLVIATLAYPFIEPTLLQVDYHTVEVPGLHNNLRGLKIAFVSDIHQGSFFSQSRTRTLINEINSLGADIVILGGDYSQDAESAIDFFKTTPPIQARLGVFAVIGEADRNDASDNISRLVGEMKNYGCLALVNNMNRVKAGQAYVYIVGIDDFYKGTPNATEVAAQVSKDDFVILAAHSPDILPSAQRAKSKEGSNHWFDLALFGHTHGGQITLLGRTLLPRKITEVSARYLTGWRTENRADILVSNGVGSETLPLRLFAVPQIHLVTLKAK